VCNCSKRIPCTLLVTLPNLSYFALLQGPSAFNSAVLDFLRNYKWGADYHQQIWLRIRMIDWKPIHAYRGKYMACLEAGTREGPQRVCAVKRRRFPVGVNPTRRRCSSRK